MEWWLQAALAAVVIGAVTAVTVQLARGARSFGRELAGAREQVKLQERSPVDWARGVPQLWRRAAVMPEIQVDAVRGLLGLAAVQSVQLHAVAREPEPVTDPFAGSGGFAVPVEVAAPVSAEPPVFFKDGEPRSLAEYLGQRHVTTYLGALIAGADRGVVVPAEHQLFCGPAGMGKTLLARVFANSLNQRNERLGLPHVHFQEEFPADLPDLKALDRAVREAQQRPTVLFIDEIHDLTDRHTLKLYGLMEDGRYKFEGDPFPVPVPNVMLVGATTDYGMMHPALKRRFNRHFLEPMTQDEIRVVVEGRSFPIVPKAVELLVSRTHFSGAPWEALQLYRQAQAFAKARQSAAIETSDVQLVFDSQRLDELGLGWMDRKVLQVLLRHPRYRRGRGKDAPEEFVCFAASENDVVAMAQLDRGEYREVIKPKLMARGLLQVRATYGQALTPHGAATYGWLAQQ